MLCRTRDYLSYLWTTEPSNSWSSKLPKINLNYKVGLRTSHKELLYIVHYYQYKCIPCYILRFIVLYLLYENIV